MTLTEIAIFVSGLLAGIALGIEIGYWAGSRP